MEIDPRLMQPSILWIAAIFIIGLIGRGIYALYQGWEAARVSQNHQQALDRQKALEAEREKWNRQQPS